MRDLQAIYWNCIGLLTEIGIDYGTITEVTVNHRAKKRWGQCKGSFAGYASNGERRYTYSINISEILLDERVPIESLQNTVIHEILHTCPGCQNHGPEWKRRADKVKKELGYNIKRCTNAAEKGISETVTERYYDPDKYKVRCKKCGKVIGKSRMCNLVKYPQTYVHTKCNGTFERIQ